MKEPRSGRCALALVLLFGSFVAMAHPAAAIDWTLFKDPNDGALDLSGWLMSKGGFMPVPIIITEPAIGAGFRRESGEARCIVGRHRKIVTYSG